MIAECSACRLHKTARHFVFASGNPDAGVVVIVEAPGPDEDARGEPFVGRAGTLLRKLLADVGFDETTAYFSNTVKCLPTDDGRAVRKPADDEVAACTAKWTFPELRALAPLKAIVAVGGVAASAVLGRAVAITRARGTVLPSPFCPSVVPILHPSYLLRWGEDPELMRLTREDLALVRSLVDAAGEHLGQVEVAERVSAVKSIQLRDDEKAQFEQRIVQAPAWHPGRKYVAGWSDERDVVLLYRDEAGERRTERVTGVPWYFYMRTGDALRVPAPFWEFARRLGVVERIEADAVDADWTRVYAVRKVTQTNWLKDRGESGVGINILTDEISVKKALKVGRKEVESGATGGRRDRQTSRVISSINREESMSEARGHLYGSAELTAFASFGLDLSSAVTPPRRRNPNGYRMNWAMFEADTKLRDVLTALHAYGPTFEADLTPKQRFMTDRYVEVDDKYHELYFDIETDDSVPGWENKETWRHLSYAAVFRDRDGREERMSLVLDREDDASEAAMLGEVKRWIDRADILYAWNGFNFDFPILRDRFRRYGIDYDWRHVIWCDLLAVWRRYHYRSASAVTSFALGDLGPAVLHREKLDWRAESARRGKPVNRIVDLYRELPELLREYNEVDADLLRALEAEFGYAAIERVFCRIGNTFANDYNVSTKVDMLLLNQGSARGRHFLTRGLQLKALPAYVAEQQRQTVRRLGADGEVETVATSAVDRARRGKGRESEGSEYTGAYVFPPVVGYHEGVAALDFKSLYPTVMTLFNISPETWVSRDDVPAALRERPTPEALDAADLTLAPSGAFFRKAEPGMIPLVFRQTMEKRKVYSKLQLAETIGSDRFLLYYRLSYAYKRLGLSVIRTSKISYDLNGRIFKENIESLWEGILYDKAYRGDAEDYAFSAGSSLELLRQDRIHHQRGLLGLDRCGTAADAEDLGTGKWAKDPAAEPEAIRLSHVRPRWPVWTTEAPLAWDEQGKHGGRVAQEPSSRVSRVAYCAVEEGYRRRISEGVDRRGARSTCPTGRDLRRAVPGQAEAAGAARADAAVAAAGVSGPGPSGAARGGARASLGARPHVVVDGDLEILDVRGLGYRARSIDAAGVPAMAQVARLIRHRLGAVRLFRVSLDVGASVTVTEDHSLLVLRGSSLLVTRAPDVGVGARMLVESGCGFSVGIVVSVDEVPGDPREYVYDIQVDTEDPRSCRGPVRPAFVADGVLVHNSFY